MLHQQVMAAIANALDLDSSGTHDLFDMFVSRKQKDPYYELLRQEILAICLSEGEPIPRRDFGPRAEDWLRRTYETLRATETGS